MTKLDKTINAVTAIVSSYLPVTEVIGKKLLLQSEVGCDSLSLLEIIMDIEEEYDIALLGVLQEDPTIAEISDLIIAELKT